jgi:hypothetical protein
VASRCPRCDAPQDGDRNFCTRCGYELAAAVAAPDADAPAAPDSAPAVEPRFVACPACGATNAASRRRCARCGSALDESEAAEEPHDELEAEPAPPIEGWDPEPKGSTLVFVAAVTVAGLAIVGVIFTILSASGVIGGGDQVVVEAEDELLPVASIRASSVLPPSDGSSYEPEHLIDADTTTVWREAASGDGVGEWVELQLEGSPEVSRLLVWNGDQRSGRFASANRIAEVRIELGDRTFTAELLDIRGPQAVDLPEIVETSSIRLTILQVTGNVAEEPGATALSGIEVRGPPRTAADDA